MAIFLENHGPESRMTVTGFCSGGDQLENSETVEFFYQL